MVDWANLIGLGLGSGSGLDVFVSYTVTLNHRVEHVVNPPPSGEGGGSENYGCTLKTTVACV